MLKALGLPRLRATVDGRIFSAAVVVGVMTAAVKGVALLKEVLVAGAFGTSDELDAFLLAFLLPSFAITVVAGSFNAAFLPTYVRVRTERGPAAAQRLFSSVLMVSLVLLACATAAILLLAFAALPALASGFPAAKLERTRALLLLLAPVILLRGLSTLFAAVLNATERFALAALAPALVPAALIALLLAFGARFGGLVLVSGTLAGMAAEAFVLAAALRRRGVSVRPRRPVLDADLRRVAGQYLPMISAALLLCGTTVVDQSMAAMLGAGSVAALAYATKIVALPLGLGVTALGTAAIPYFSQLLARGDASGARRTLRRYLRLVFAVTIPATILLVAAAQPVTALLFERGSFTPADTERVAAILALLVLQVPFHMAGVLVVRLLSAMLANRVLLYGNLLSLALNVGLNLLFMHRLGAAGIALSTSCVYLVSFFFLLACSRRIARREACA